MPVLALSPAVAQRRAARHRPSRGSATSARAAASSRTRDVVIFLYRDGEQNADAEVELVKAKVAKHRNGPIGEVPLQFRKANTRFYTVAAREEIAAY